ncbi:hypothetical protein ACFP81_13805 [Deinococcus lacus]|uniref:Uncharacterized protein n=1 Tax=Deinococcus lacus TaxID=392561 RepID=A0ABW1YJC1_9DEIO
MIEERLAAELLPYLEGTAEGEQFSIEPTSELSSLLEYYIYWCVLENCTRLPYSIDGLYVNSAKKIGICGVEIYGMAYLLISHNGSGSITPFYVYLSMDEKSGGFSKVSIKLDDEGWNGRKTHVVETLNAPIGKVAWRYVVDIDGPKS